MASHESPHVEPTLTDHEVVDDHHVKVGKVTDVIYDETPGARPRWATVKMHAVGREHLAPLEGSYMSDDGRLVLAFDKERVKHAPTAPHDHVLSRELEQELVRHYALADA